MDKNTTYLDVNSKNNVSFRISLLCLGRKEILLKDKEILKKKEELYS